MRKIALILLFAIILTGCANKGNTRAEPSKIVEKQRVQTQKTEEKEAEYREISGEEAYRRLMEEEGIFLMDVRPSQAFTDEHLTGAYSQPLDEEFEQSLKSTPLKADTVIFFYSDDEATNKKAFEELTRLGYSNIYSIGLFKNWDKETTIGACPAPNPYPGQQVWDELWTEWWEDKQK